ncbi:transposase domain-containing protein [Hoeflea sp.]|uniref:transposase domain-containing protein n=1 Tax=Hoeflea sp. TaxID=1940281 RepID=UPI003B021B3D
MHDFEDGTDTITIKGGLKFSDLTITNNAQGHAAITGYNASIRVDGNDGDNTDQPARCASLTGTCKLNGVNPQVYLTDTLRRIIDMHPQSRIDELMSWNFAPTIPGVTRQQG